MLIDVLSQSFGKWLGEIKKKDNIFTLFMEEFYDYMKKIYLCNLSLIINPFASLPEPH